MGAFCLKDRTIEDWFKGTQTKVHYSVIPEDSTAKIISDSSAFAAWVTCNIKSPESFAKRFGDRLNAMHPKSTSLEGWSFGHYEIYNRDGLHPVGFGKNILDDYALKEITQMNPPVDWSHAQMHNIKRLKMRILLTILTILLIPAICFSQQKHTHVPAKKYYDPLLYHDTTKIKVNVITYVMENDSCGICHLWYKVRQNVDTFSTRRKAKYSNQVKAERDYKSLKVFLLRVKKKQ
jgi:hypothetical protein